MAYPPTLAALPPLNLPMIRSVSPVNQRVPLPESGPTGLAGFLAKPGLAQALLAFGSSMLAESDRPGGSLGGAIGRSVPSGIQAFQQGAQEAEVDKLTQTMPPEMQQLLRALPPAQRVPAMLQLMQKPAPVAVGANERLVDPGTGETVVDAMPETPEPPADIQTFREFLNMPPEQQQQYLAFLAAKRPPGTTVNVNGPEGAVQGAIAKSVAETIEGDDAARDSIAQVGSIDRIIEITSNPKFAQVSGPLMGGKWGELSARFRDDPEARALLAEFNAIGGQMTMAQLEAFTGPKTDFEFQQARRLAFNDPSMTPEEIQAGLRVYRRAAVENAKRWADRILDLDPERLKFDPRDLAPQLDLARQITERFSEQGGTADPLGIRR